LKELNKEACLHFWGIAAAMGMCIPGKLDVHSQQRGIENSESLKRREALSENKSSEVVFKAPK